GPAPVAAPAGCEQDVPKRTAPAPPELAAAPGGPVVSSVRDQAGVTRVEGFVPMNPTQWVGAWRERKDVKLLFSESEGFEGEVFAQVTGAQVFYKFRKVCESGS